MKTRRQVQPDQAVSQLLPQGRLHEPVLEAAWLQAAQRLNIDGSGIWELLCVTAGSDRAAGVKSWPNGINFDCEN